MAIQNPNKAMQNAVNQLNPQDQKSEETIISLLQNQTKSLTSILQATSLSDGEREVTNNSLKTSASHLTSISGKLGSVTNTLSSLNSSVSPLKGQMDTAVSLLGSIKTSLMNITGVLSAFRADYLMASNGVTADGTGYINKQLISSDLRALAGIEDSSLRHSLQIMQKAANFADLMSNAVRPKIGNTKQFKEDEGQGLVSKLLGKLSPDMAEAGQSLIPILQMFNPNFDDTNIKTLLGSFMGPDKTKTILNPINELIGSWMNSPDNGKGFNAKQMLAGKINELTGFGDDTKQVKKERDPNLVMSALAPYADDIAQIAEAEYERVLKTPKGIPAYATPVWVVNSKDQTNHFEKSNNNQETKEREMLLKKIEDFLEGHNVNKRDKDGNELGKFNRVTGEMDGTLFTDEKYLKALGVDGKSYNEKFERVAGIEKNKRKERNLQRGTAKTVHRDENGELQQRELRTIYSTLEDVTSNGAIDDVIGAGNALLNVGSGFKNGGAVGGLFSLVPTLLSGGLKPLTSKQGRENLKSGVTGAMNQLKSNYERDKAFNEGVNPTPTTEIEGDANPLNNAHKNFACILSEKIYNLFGGNKSERKKSEKNIEKIVSLVISKLNFKDPESLEKSVTDNIESIVEEIGKEYGNEKAEQIGDIIIDNFGASFSYTPKDKELKDWMDKLTPQAYHSGKKGKKKKGKVNKSSKKSSVQGYPEALVSDSDTVVPEAKVRDEVNSEVDETSILVTIASSMGGMSKLVANMNEDIIKASNGQPVDGKHKNKYSPFNLIRKVFTKTSAVNEKSGSKAMAVIKDAERETDISKDISVKQKKDDKKETEKKEKNKLKPTEQKDNIFTKFLKEKVFHGVNKKLNKIKKGIGKKLTKFKEAKERMTDGIANKAKEKFGKAKDFAVGKMKSLGKKIANTKVGKKIGNIGKGIGKKFKATFGKKSKIGRGLRKTKIGAKKLGKKLSITRKMNKIGKKLGGKSKAEKAEEERQKKELEAAEAAKKEQIEAAKKAGKKKEEGEDKRQKELDNAEKKMEDDSKKANDEINKDKTDATKKEIKKDERSNATVRSQKSASEAAIAAQKTAATGTEIAADTAATVTATTVETGAATASAAIETTGSGIEAAAAANSGSPLTTPVGIGLAVGGAAIIATLVAKFMKSIKKGEAPNVDEAAKAGHGGGGGGFGGDAAKQVKDAKKKQEEEKKKEEKEKKKEERKKKLKKVGKTIGKVVGGLAFGVVGGLVGRLFKKKQKVYIDSDGTVKRKEDHQPIDFEGKPINNENGGNAEGEEQQEPLNVKTKEGKKAFLKQVLKGNLKIVKNPNKSSLQQRKEKQMSLDEKKIDNAVSKSNSSNPNEEANGAQKKNKLSGLLANTKMAKIMKLVLIASAPMLFLGNKMKRGLEQLVQSSFGQMLMKKPEDASGILFNMSGGGTALSLAKSLGSKVSSLANGGASKIADLIGGVFSGIFGGDKDSGKTATSSNLADGSYSENATLAYYQNEKRKASDKFLNDMTKSLNIVSEEEMKETEKTVSQIVNEEQQKKMLSIAVNGTIGSGGASGAKNSASGKFNVSGVVQNITEGNGSSISLQNMNAADFFLSTMPDSYISSGIYRSTGEFHGGTDYAAPEGTAVYSPTGGTVTRSSLDEGMSPTMGHFVIFKGNDGKYYRLMHFVEAPSLKTGDTIKAGDLVGFVGTTPGEPYSTGNHLHIDISNVDTTHASATDNPNACIDTETYSLTGLGNKKKNDKKYVGSSKLAPFNTNLLEDKISKDIGAYGRRNHIYQRDYSDIAYNSSKDSTYQTLGDSGCGPAAAATIKGIYGRGKSTNKNRFGIRSRAGKYGKGINVTSDMFPGDSVQEKFWRFMIANGCSMEWTAGIMGNIQQESGFDPFVMEGGNTSTTVPYSSGGYGLIQWTSAEYQASADEACKKLTNGSYGLNSMEGQFVLILGIATCSPDVIALQDGMSSYAANCLKAVGGLDYLNKLSVIEACDIWESEVERAGKPNMENRHAYAQEYFDKFSVGDFSGVNIGLNTGSTSSASPSGSQTSGVLNLLLDSYVDVSVLDQYVTNKSSDENKSETDSNSADSKKKSSSSSSSSNKDTKSNSKNSSNSSSAKPNTSSSNNKSSSSSSNNSSSTNFSPVGKHTKNTNNSNNTATSSYTFSPIGRHTNPTDYYPLTSSNNSTGSNTFSNNSTSSNSSVSTFTTGNSSNALINNGNNSIVVCNNFDKTVSLNVEGIISHFQHLNSTQSKALKVLKEISKLINDESGEPTFLLDNNGLDIILRGL